METQQKPEQALPIIERVQRLRERIARYNAEVAKMPIPAEKRVDAYELTRIKKSYEWQMWQKSDISAYAGNEGEHSCK